MGSVCVIIIFHVWFKPRQNTGRTPPWDVSNCTHNLSKQSRQAVQRPRCPNVCKIIWTVAEESLHSGQSGCNYSVRTRSHGAFQMYDLSFQTKDLKHLSPQVTRCMSGGGIWDNSVCLHTIFLWQINLHWLTGCTRSSSFTTFTSVLMQPC